MWAVQLLRSPQLKKIRTNQTRWQITGNKCLHDVYMFTKCYMGKQGNNHREKAFPWTVSYRCYVRGIWLINMTDNKIIWVFVQKTVLETWSKQVPSTSFYRHDRQYSPVLLKAEVRTWDDEHSTNRTNHQCGTDTVNVKVLFIQMLVKNYSVKQRSLWLLML